MSGVQQHLACTVEPVRLRALAAAEVMVRKLLPMVAEGLDFKLPAEQVEVAVRAACMLSAHWQFIWRYGW